MRSQRQLQETILGPEKNSAFLPRGWGPTHEGQLAGECVVADADQEEATWGPGEIPTCSNIAEALSK